MLAPTLMCLSCILPSLLCSHAVLCRDLPSPAASDAGPIDDPELSSRSLAIRSPMDVKSYTSYTEFPFSVSHKDVNIGGIPITVDGLEEVPPEATHVDMVWLLHGRGDRRQGMQNFAHPIVTSWRRRERRAGRDSKRLGLIAISFDQRNHGPRETEPMMSQGWTQGNERHAQDMAAIYRETPASPCSSRFPGRSCT